MADHLPARRTLPAPARPDYHALHAATGVGHTVAAVTGECIVCGAERSTSWTPATLDGLRHRHKVDLVVGHVCVGCIEWAEERAAASRREALRASMLRTIQR